MKLYVVEIAGKYLKGGGCRYDLVDDINRARTYSSKTYAKSSINQTIKCLWNESEIEQFKHAKIIEGEIIFNI